MLALNKFIVPSLVCVLLVCRTQCDRDAASSAKKDRVTKQDEKVRHAKQHEDVEFAHKLENAPIPSMHDGPQLFRSEHIGDFVRSRTRRYISPKDLLNPQKPHQKNELPQQDVASGNDEGISKQFHHPGHSSQLSSLHPTNTYNYYKIANNYGGAFPYGTNETFKGYTKTTNIGIVPPRGVSTNNYYNSISGLSQYPIIAKHFNGLSKSLYANVDYTSYGYGHGTRDYGNNAYGNVLTGLAMWSILNGLVNGIRYTVYNHTNVPQEYSTNIILSNDTIVSCFEDAKALCHGNTRPLCISNGTTFCVSSSEMVTCDGEKKGKTCVNITAPCDNCGHSQPTYVACAVNITILGGPVEKSNNTLDVSNGSDDEDVILCATTLIVPQKNNPNRPSCVGKSACLENVGQDDGNIVESTASSAERK